ncbi:signal peptidase I [Natranaerovirga pectinivora]|uniref:Signal peptidase I n=1 Tax=Natranaerovirga pectinivora TaxID=682400 RepID=A0A4R3MLZ2_9FIRM|nr:signal peptidase I [Natranaerovirga pectinivora]TCT13950.1 signal peptidase I [Natranaerovirga pectinivora]
MKLLDKIEMLEWIKIIIFSLLVILLFHWIIWPIRVYGRSMEKTLYHNDFMIISKAITFINPIENGDIIVIEVPMDDKEALAVKRIIGVSGDHVIIKDEDVYVNGIKINEDYILGKTYGDIDTIVENGYVFVLGDNRQISKDSRDFGSIPLNKIRGKVIVNFRFM